MKRTPLLALLDAYQPHDPDEKNHKETIAAFVRDNPDCFERTLTSGHITASSWLLNKDKTHALLLHHKKLDRWLQLGGHCDGDPDTLAVAIKEAQEESGILNIEPLFCAIFDVDVHLIPETPKAAAHYHYDIRFLLHVTSNEMVIQNNESNALQWISKELHALPTNERSVTRMFEKWCALF